MQPIPYSMLVQLIEGAATFLNGAFSFAIDFMMDDPFKTNIEKITQAEDTAKSVALVFVSLLFIIEFFTKTLNFEWIKWENVLMLFMKLIVARILINNAPQVMEMVFNGFNALMTTAFDKDSLEFFPTGQNAVNVFLTGSEQTDLATPKGWLDLRPYQKMVDIVPYTMALTVMAYFIQIIAVGRIFELIVYKVISPLPLACFASSATADIGKSFLKNYAAVCLQAFMILILFIAYPTVQSLITASTSDVIIKILPIFVLGAAIGKSGSWAKKMLGVI